MSSSPTSAPTSHRHERTALISLLTVTAIWGSTFVVVKNAVARMPVMDFLAWRFAIAAIAMAAVRPRAVTTLGRRGVGIGVILGIALGSGYVTQTLGLQRTPADVSGFITGLMVVFAPLCGAVLLRDRLSGATWLAVAMATVGLGLISLDGFSIGSGELLTLACALAFGLHIVGLGEWSSSYDAAGLAVVQLTTVALVSIVAAAPSSLAPPPDLKVWGAIALTAIPGTAVAFFVQTWAQAQLAPARAAVVLTMEPVFAGIFGVAFGGDSLTVRIVVGAVLVVAAMYVVELGPRQAKDAAVARFE